MRIALAFAALVCAWQLAPALANAEDLDSLPSDQPAAAKPDTAPEPEAAAPPAPRQEAAKEEAKPSAEPARAQGPPPVVAGAPKPPAATPAGQKVIEEIVVTAQKREQFIQDVPISMTVLDAEFMAEQGVTDVREALLFVPNAKVEVAGFFAAPRIRGFSFNNNNKAFEPPAGLALDGIPYTRVGYFAAALFDVDRLEVLRGPQGTTFGKNTTAGVISIVTKNPSDELGGFTDFQVGDQGRRRIEVGVGGPLIANFVNFRLAGLSDEADGFVRNTTAALSPMASRILRGKDRTGFRGKLGFPNLLGSDLVLTYEQVELQDGGAGLEMYHVGSADSG